MPISLPITAQAAAAQALYALPQPVRRAIAGKPIRLDGQQLALDAQLLLRLQQLSGQELVVENVENSRRSMEAATPIVSGKPIKAVTTKELACPGEAGDVLATLYTPTGLASPSGLLVFYHGGGWVIGSRNSHDNTARFLAARAGVKVLSVEYRRAPENPFPAAVDDAMCAFDYASTKASELGVDPARIAVGGDSAGGNLAAVVAQQSVPAKRPPAFQLLLYPAVDASVRRRSRELFADGFFLTDAHMTWFLDHYAQPGVDRTDPKLSPLLAGDITGLAPAYIATAGFDPLRDEGEAYADKLADAGVPTALSRQSDLIHGYANFLSAGRRPTEALAEAAGALRVGLSRS